MRRRAIDRGKPGADVGEADAAAFGFGETAAVVGYADAQRVVAQVGIDADRSSLGQWTEAVLDRVFSKRDQHRRRKEKCAQRWRYGDFKGQPSAHADLLHIEVGA